MKEHKISLPTAILFNMNIMIGSGILIGPAASAAISGNASFLAWPLVALFFLPIVLTTIELSRMFPGAGGFYLYAKQGLNENAGYLSGMLYLIGYTFAASVEVLALRKTLLNSLAPNVITTNPLLFNIIITGIAVVFSLLSLKIVSNFLNSLTLAKILPLVILVLLLPLIFNPSFTVTCAELSLLPASLALPIFGYFGFEYCVGISHLIKDSEKNAPRAILIGFLATGLLYMLFHFGLLNLMGAKDLATYGAPAFADFINLPIPYLKSLLKILIPAAAILTLFAGMLGMINANAILLQSMAKENLFKGSTLLLPVNKLQRPWAALLFFGALVFAIATIIPSIPLTGGLCVLGVFLSFILPFISLLLIQKKHGIGAHKKIITALGLIIVVLFSIYSFYTLSPSMSERLLYTVVLIAAIVLAWLVKNNKR
jgi:basic amino acid/polyamine antiporter, APA family